MQEILEQIVAKFDEGEFVLVIGEEDVSKCYCTASQKDVYYLMLQTAKGLSNLKVAEERVFGSCLLKGADDATNNMACQIGEEMDEFPFFLAAVRLEGGEFAVWGKGYPVVLCYYAMRTCVTMERMNEGPFDSPSVSPFDINSINLN
jgi:hypothetical protein